MARSRSSNSLKQKVTVYVGGSFLLLVVLASWFPRSCPLLRQVLAPCPAVRVVNTPSTTFERDIARIPHQLIDRNLVEFSANAQEYRKTTELRFHFRGDLTKSVAYLAIRASTSPVQEPNGSSVQATPSTSERTTIERLSLVTHPLLQDLTWSRFTSTQPNVSMYQREARFDTIDDLQKNLPPARTLAIDSIIAKRWGLDYTQYTSLDELTSLDGINYVVTSYTPPTPDGVWLQYRQTFDLQSAFVNKEGMLEGMIIMSNVQNTDPPFLLSSIGVDYRTLK